MKKRHFIILIMIIVGCNNGVQKHKITKVDSTVKTIDTTIEMDRNADSKLLTFCREKIIGAWHTKEDPELIMWFKSGNVYNDNIIKGEGLYSISFKSCDNTKYNGDSAVYLKTVFTTLSGNRRATCNKISKLDDEQLTLTDQNGQLTTYVHAEE